VGIGKICDTCYAPTIDKKIVNGKKSCLDCGVFGSEHFSGKASLRCFTCSEKAELIKPCIKCGDRTNETKLLMGVGYHCKPCGDARELEIKLKKEEIIKTQTKTCGNCGIVSIEINDKVRLFGRQKYLCLSCYKDLRLKLKERKPCLICGTKTSSEFSSKKRYCNKCVSNHTLISEFNENKKKDFAASSYYQQNKEKIKQNYHNNPDKKVRVRQQALEWKAKNPLRFKLLQCKSRAKDKGFPFSLTEECIELLFISQNNSCFYTGDPIDLNNFSVDRINCDLGYTNRNIVLCCSDANIARNNLTHEEFFDLITKIYNHSVVKGHGGRFL
jgi:hypothetical protein